MDDLHEGEDGEERIEITDTGEHHGAYSTRCQLNTPSLRPQATGEEQTMSDVWVATNNGGSSEFMLIHPDELRTLRISPDRRRVLTFTPRRDTVETMIVNSPDSPLPSDGIFEILPPLPPCFHLDLLEKVFSVQRSQSRREGQTLLPVVVIRAECDGEEWQWRDEQYETFRDRMAAAHLAGVDGRNR